MSTIIAWCSYEELLLESSDEEGEQEKGKRKKAVKTSQGQQVVQSRRGRAWIREGTEDEPLNFLDPSVAKRVSGELTTMSETRAHSRRAL